MLRATFTLWNEREDAHQMGPSEFQLAIEDGLNTARAHAALAKGLRTKLIDQAISACAQEGGTDGDKPCSACS